MHLHLSIIVGAALAASTLSADRRQDEAPEQDADSRLERIAREIEDDIEVLSGLEFRRPVKVETLGQEGLVAYVKGKMAEEKEAAAHTERMYKLLGLVPHDASVEQLTLNLLADQVGGLYDPPTNTFYVMDSVGDDLGRIVMSHEFVHALDDQYHDLDAIDEARVHNGDARLAAHAVAEGSAMVLMTSWFMQNMATLDPAALQESMESQGVETLQGVPDVLWKPLLGVYQRGQMFLDHPKGSWQEAKQAAYTTPPRSTEQVLHPKKYWSEEHRDEPITFDLALAGEAPEGAKILHQDTLGELMLAILTTPVDKRGAPKSNLGMALIRYTNPAARGWGGDRWALVEVGGGHLLHLATRWDTEADAREFEEALSGQFSGADDRQLQRIGSSVILDVWTGLDAGTAASVRGHVLQVQEETASEEAGD